MSQVRPQIKHAARRGADFYLGVAVGSSVGFELLLLLLLALLSLLLLLVELPLDLGRDVGRLRAVGEKMVMTVRSRLHGGGGGCAACSGCFVRLIKSVFTLTEDSGKEESSSAATVNS